MKRLASVLCTGLLLVMAGSALALNPTSNVYDEAALQAEKANPTQVPNENPRSGGENQGTATVIGALPYSDSDNTCGHVNDYTPSCASSSAPDLVYRFTPATNQNVTLSTCGSSYDTMIHVHQGSIPNEIACNDDFCGLQSQLVVPMTAGNTYYIVIDGFSSGCGTYTLNVTGPPPPCAPCPAGAQLEGEPTCGPNYNDVFNGGCNSTPPVFSDVVCNRVCGEMGTFLFNNQQYRDTDWYRVSGSGTYSGIADGFTLRIFVLTPVCPTSILSTTSTPACVQSSNLNIPGPNNYLFAGTDVFSGVPCGTRYVLSISQYPTCGVTAVESSTWGHIKGAYR